MSAIPTDRLLAFPDTGTCTVIREGIARRHYTWSSLTWDRRFLPWPRAPKNGQDGTPA